MVLEYIGASRDDLMGRIVAGSVSGTYRSVPDRDGSDEHAMIVTIAEEPAYMRVILHFERSDEASDPVHMRVPYERVYLHFRMDPFRGLIGAIFARSSYKMCINYFGYMADQVSRQISLAHDARVTGQMMARVGG